MRRKSKTRINKPSAGYEGRMVISAASVPDPFEPTKKMAVARNIAAPIDTMMARREINNVQRAACDWFRNLYDCASIGGARAIDYGREYVDGGRVAQPLSETVLHAGRNLKTLIGWQGVGSNGYVLLVRIIGEERGVVELAKTWPGSGDQKRREGYIKGRFLEAVDAIVRERDMIAKGKVRAAIVAERNIESAGLMTEWEVGRFGDWYPVARAGR
jgi:hypothetical protein